MKPIPYCPPKALAALIQLNNSGQPPETRSQMWWLLISRGWMDGQCQITRKGRDYVNLRLSKL